MIFKNEVNKRKNIILQKIYLFWIQYKKFLIRNTFCRAQQPLCKRHFGVLYSLFKICRFGHPRSYISITMSGILKICCSQAHFSSPFTKITLLSDRIGLSDCITSSSVVVPPLHPRSWWLNSSHLAWYCNSRGNSVISYGDFIKKCWSSFPLFITAISFRTNSLLIPL